ncbi:serine protease FAM111A-like isoform X2 [Tachysurus vachellii]|uniref:serine protease FAM111A-like isoform X2 n=1 Tax=Tachysurus vachellii TaxID=175792 RepID=UPI00296ABACD|nr:serine protease FAM111A-like isoform X2 [Tachysurus vachellii]XP_060739426.1 serine protease FAM111A-like isoform X2 [Tachysurus vachellii]
MAKCYKEEGERCGLDSDTTQIKTENHGHSLRFRVHQEIKKFAVTCDKPRTILETFQTNFYFKAICKKKQNGRNKEIVIRREQMPRAAVTPHFPCCLLNDNELLDLEFIRSGENSNTAKPPKFTVHKRENLVCFYIQTRGDENIRRLMKNNELTRTVDYMCVYAVKGEKVKVALKRDGRFRGVIFRKGALYEQETESIINLSNLVDHLDGKQFQVKVSPHPTGSQESSQELSQESEEIVKDEKSEASETHQEEKPNQNSTTAQEKKTDAPPNEKKWRKFPDTKKITNTEEILKLLREQHGDLLKTLKERENVDVKKFFREEYDKSTQRFLEVKNVKQLMDRSDSVCQLRVNDSAVGSGFLLFGRFILTNAHVVGDLVPRSSKLKQKLTAAFHFEDLTSVGNVIPVEENAVAYLKEKDDMGNYLDFALLELSRDVKLPELLTFYSPPPTRGAVCIIGHPGGGVKQMDPSFIIAKEDIPQAAETYFKKNPNIHVFHVITQQCLTEDKEMHESKIFYHSCFFHGSSGSPLFDQHCNLIGVHTGGYVYEGERKKTRSVMEYSFPLIHILVNIFIQCSNEKRSDVVQYFESQSNMKYVVQVAKEQLDRNSQPMDTS